MEKVKSFIDREIGLEADTLVLVALSGGADSTALLLIMKELGYRLHALHCNFHLRLEESDRDQAFVEELSGQHGVPLSVRHFETGNFAREHGMSIEMAARELRYGWFREELHGRPGCCVAVGHHGDDQAETLLLNLLRGTGIRGLAGMQPRRDGIIRPLLCLSREEILRYLTRRGQSYVTDSTNRERICQRNRIRLDLVPLLREMNPHAARHLCLAGDSVRQSIPYYMKGIEAAFRENGITADSFPLKALPSPPLLHEWLAGKGFSRAEEEEMCRAREGSVGRMWHSETHAVLLDRQALLLAPLGQTHAAPRLSGEIVPSIGETGTGIAYFDADLLTAPLEVRPVGEGDAFVPLGMKGRKLISDFLTDRKVNRFRKAEVFVLTCGEDIVWLIGYRSDNRFRVTEKTRRILKLTCLPSGKPSSCSHPEGCSPSFL